MIMSLIYWKRFAQHEIKNSKIYKECVSSLAPLPNRDFEVFEKQFLLEYYTERANFSISFNFLELIYIWHVSFCT